MPDISICSCYLPSPQLILGTDPSSPRDKVPGQHYVSDTEGSGKEASGMCQKVETLVWAMVLTLKRTDVTQR